MIPPSEFAEYTAFVAVADARSFRRAALHLKLKPSTLSHSVRALEERLGIRLLARTTRTVAPTEAGLALLERVRPALETLDGAAEVVNPHRAHPGGTVRLTLPQGAATAVLAPKLASFVAAYPDITLDAVVDDKLVDIVRNGFDAGIRLGEQVADGMTAVRVSSGLSAAVVASPSYWAARSPPATPRDLAHHRCIDRRYATDGGIQHWRFVRGEERVEVVGGGRLILNSEALMRRAVLDGAGVAMLAEPEVADDIAAGRLVRVLREWCPLMYEFFLYHPSRRLPSASLGALIETFRV